MGPLAARPPRTSVMAGSGPKEGQHRGQTESEEPAGPTRKWTWVGHPGQRQLRIPGLGRPSRARGPGLAPSTTHTATEGSRAQSLWVPLPPEGKLRNRRLWNSSKPWPSFNSSEARISRQQRFDCSLSSLSVSQSRVLLFYYCFSNPLRALRSARAAGKVHREGGALGSSGEGLPACLLAHQSRSSAY